MNEPTRFVKVQYSAVIELRESVDGIDEQSPLKMATTIMLTGINYVMDDNHALRAYGAKFKVGLTQAPATKQKKGKTR